MFTLIFLHVFHRQLQPSFSENGRCLDVDLFRNKMQLNWPLNAGKAYVGTIGTLRVYASKAVMAGMQGTKFSVM